eukprot:GEZU01011296.1.p2 GENE.GEZU01011296.1~~GEZU01011296.1.p2  ORF type:complete len:126 (+),score=36.41 GEZU01011296.1:230-607(+)
MNYKEYGVYLRAMERKAKAKKEFEIEQGIYDWEKARKLKKEKSIKNRLAKYRKMRLLGAPDQVGENKLGRSVAVGSVGHWRMGALVLSQRDIERVKNEGQLRRKGGQKRKHSGGKGGGGGKKSRK